ncbi:receptor like protein 22-like [Magnolia sinica]|uniref:receptor like protein 22-like n=1 Tax=Magnolia sinica TaxID=86752 RepID=UPI00265997C1|nr:receptor like protein 22-like [Magnolia sinica]
MALLFSSKNNPAFLILFFLSSLLFLTTQQCNHHHFSALLHLKHRFNFIDDYTLSTLPSWNSNNTDCCSWERITCDGPTGHVISLDLSELCISGRIDFESLFHLRSLQRLNLAYNEFDPSPFPYGFDQLTSLTHLNLSHLSFYGQIPLEISRLTTLVSLDLSKNYYYNGSGYQYLKLENPSIGAVVQNLSNLSELYLDWVHILLQGQTLDLPLPTLRKLSLIDCLPSGSIYSSLSQLHFLSELNLSYNNLSSAVPSFPESLRKLILQDCSIYSSLSQLHFLSELDVSRNNLSSAVPSFPVSLRKLILQDYNNLSVQYGSGNSTFVSIPQFQSLLLRSCNISTLPNFLRNQEQLRRLDLSNNKISGEIPKWIWEGIVPSPHLLVSDFSVLDISSNKLEGSLPIPPPFIFFFSIPPCLGEIGHSLIVLNLQGNAFNGTLLQTFKEGCNIETLDLSGNQLEGQVPRSLVNCKMLEVLNLANNQIHDTFPFWSEALSQLRVFILRSNQFHGTIGHLLTNQAFPLLQIFDLSFNSFEGNLPSNMFKSWTAMMEDDKSQSLVLGKMIYGRSSIYYQNKVSVASKGLMMEVVKILTAFTVVDLSGNKFYGHIPESIGDLKSLLVLNMSNNDLTGGIPISLQNLRDLESLDLSHNKLSEEIPWQLTELTFLAVLNLSQNFLIGKIPQSRQFLTFNNESFKGNLGLCGPPLSNKCEDAKSAPSPTLSTLQFERKYDWELMWLGFGVGYGVGVGMLFWTLALWRKGRREFYIFVDGMLSLIFPSMVFSK